jgi:60 kDa SS-A/Ro ribonucleoprotein
VAHDVLQGFNTRTTPQSEKADERQVANNAGGYVFTITPEEQLRRFLTLGTDTGSYYVGAKDLTTDNAKLVLAMAKTDHKLLVDTIVEISTAGRAPKQNPAIFALAIAASVADPCGEKDCKACSEKKGVCPKVVSEKSYALAQLSKVCRTGTTLFLFAQYVEQFRGWGKSLRRAVGNWYLDKTVDKLAYQAVKYRQRNGWSHRDLLRLAHPETEDAARKMLFDWIVRGTGGKGGDLREYLPSVVAAYEDLQANGTDVPATIRRYKNVPWEALPTDSHDDINVWKALLDTNSLPLGALIRQLPRLTNLGLFEDKEYTDKVVGLLTDQEYLRKSRIHPIAVLVAQRSYASGKGFRGTTTWQPRRRIVDALDEAFYKAFGNVEPMGGRSLLALDVSGSMTWASAVIKDTNVTAREASAALSLITAATEDEYEIVGFSSGGGWGYRDRAQLDRIPISPRQRLDDAIATVEKVPAGGTDCSLPMRWALQNDLKFDRFIVYTDNETWAGHEHPHQALAKYRAKTGIDAKLVVVGMVATPFSIADPSDAGMMDVAGFDSAVPNLISDFCRISSVEN